MAEKSIKRSKHLPRSASTESSESTSFKMTKSVNKDSKVKKPKERWLLTRKTWRYMADAGRRLIPEGAQNRPEDIPKIEAYFQEVCKKEPRFLLWRKNSYPGALGFRSKKRKDRRKSTSCRKACSADEIDDIRPERPKVLNIPSVSGSRFDLRKIREDFFNQQSQSPSSVSLFGSDQQQSPTNENYENLGDQLEEKQLINMLEEYLTICDKPNAPSTSTTRPMDFNYQELVNKLQRHLELVSRTYTAFPNIPPRRDEVHFEGDHVQKSLSETLSRYFSQYSNRDRIISDLLTNRKALEKLSFDLRKARGFRSSRGGAGYTSQTTPWITNLKHYSGPQEKERRPSPFKQPPLIEVQNENAEITYKSGGTQTLPIAESVLIKADEEYKKTLAEKEEERREQKFNHRRRSSVDHDDVSQSVSDTIKRYLRMARKKSVDSDKADRFKRVNYDRNLRNIKAKGEITKPGDDDGLNKGCQTNDEWILTYRDLKFDEISELDEIDENISSSARSSIDVGVYDTNKSSPSSPGLIQSSHSFFSNLLHGGSNKHDKTNAAAAVAAGAMQKSKSSSSVMHHGSRLMAKKIFRTRSKSQTRAAVQPSCWTPQGGCVWSNVTGRQVVLGDTTLLQLSEVERKVLQKVALAKLQALNLGVTVKIPTETVGAVVSKPKRRPYLLKRKAVTTGIFDTNRKDVEKDKDGNITGGLVFGIPLTQCVENDRLSRAASGASPFRSHGELSQEESHPMGRHGCRSSFSSLIDAPRGDDSGSCESLMSRERIVGSVPGLLDTISCSSTADIAVATAAEEEFAVPNILNVCFRHLEAHGLHTLGIFRVSTSKKRIRQLREDFDCGKETTLDDEQCPHDVATLLKEYLRDLPDPLLCRDLYHAFVHTQRIRNRRLQFEALQHLIQLLPPTNRDTLWALLNFLGTVAKHSTDTRDESGECIAGNKMDSNNLATVFAPNILHCIKPGSKDTSGDRPEDRIDVINVVRTLVDYFQQLFSISAELLDEVYVHMMDSHPETLDQLLNKRDVSASAADESVDDVDSESSSAPWTPTQPTSEMAIDQILQNVQSDTDGRNTPPEPKKTWSREEFLHEAAATGGPNVAMRIRHKDRIRERNTKKRRDDSSTRRRREDDSDRSSGSSISSAMTIISRLRGQKDDDGYTKTRSSSIESNASVHTDNDITRVLRVSEESSQSTDRRKSSPYILDKSGVITASLTIPVQTSNQALALNLDEDIPYIEDGSGYAYGLDGGKQQVTIGVVRTPTAPPRRRQRSISGSDSSGTSNIQHITGTISLVQQGYDSAVGSSATFSSPVQNTPSSVSSSIADPGVCSSPPSWASTPPTSPDSGHTSVNYIPDDVQHPAIMKTSKVKNNSPTSKDSPTLQKVSFITTSEIQQVRQAKHHESKTVHKETYQKLATTTSSDIQKSTSTPVFTTIDISKSHHEREQKFTPSITSIGNAVLRSKTADFERIAKTESKSTAKATTSTTTTTTSLEKKKYTKRRYTDSRHQTRHIPDSEALDAATNQQNKREPASASQTGPVYKRRELISSVPAK